ncbi:HEAT repeat domain-containing protein [Vibrio tapetis subsp. quintayensis]|uniref:HEAT repeat domain-containing protein n=1 Tax=Vibrio tapetis TaxID=52443 RepID=UPI0025B3D6B6|nr:HEAT repeat domain-containing protein [Vibrio tapetis]MDN3682954.1 HEAT repeat domain-containing protein [Vibrio tapetis subsp. quintayensis]
MVDLKFRYRLCLALFFLSMFSSFSVTAKYKVNYLFKIETKTRFNEDENNDANLVIEGNIALTPVFYSDYNEEGKIWWGGEIYNLTSSHNDAFLNSYKSIQTPFAFALNQEGKVVDFFFPDWLNIETQSLLKNFTYYFQYIPILDDVVIRIENDSNGGVYVKYIPKALGEGITQVVKKKLAYVQNKHEPPVQQEINHSEFSYGNNPEHVWFDKMEGTETLITRSQGIRFDMIQHVSFKSVSHEQDLSLYQLSDILNQWNIVEPRSLELSAKQRKSLAESLVRDISKLDIVNMTRRQRSNWLSQYNSVLSELNNLIIGGELSGDIKLKLFSTLSELDTKNSNKVLIDIFTQDQYSIEDREQAMIQVSFGRTNLGRASYQQLQAFLVETNVSDHRGIYSTGMFAIGNILRTREGSEQSEELYQNLSQTFLRAVTHVEQAILITALGNTARQDVAELLTVEFTQSDDRSVRQNTAYALGKCGSDLAHVSLIDMVKNEADATVNGELFNSLTEFELTAEEIDLVTAKALNVEDNRSRMKAIQAIGVQNENRQNAVSSLNVILENETDKANFRVAASLLVQLQSAD